MTNRLRLPEHGLAFSFILAPLFFGSVHSWAFLLLSFFLFLLFCFTPRSGFRFFEMPLFVKIVVSFLLLWIIAQFFLSPFNRYAAQTETMKWLAFGAAFLLIQDVDKKACVRLLLIMAMTVFFQALYGFWQLSGDHGLLWQEKKAYLDSLTGTYVNRNHVAGLLEMGLGILMGFSLSWLRHKQWGRALGFTVLWAVCFLALLKTGSRMGFLSFFGGSLAALALVACLKNRKIFLLAAGFAVLVPVLFFILPESFLPGRFLDARQFESSFLGRAHVWQTAVLILKQFPLGIGLGNFGWVYPLYQQPGLQFWSHAHFDYLELLLELGIPGFLALVILLITLIGLIFKNRKQFPEYFLLCGVFAAIFSLLIHGFFDFNFAIPANAYYFCALVAIAYRLTRPEQTEPRAFNVILKSTFIFLGFFLAAVCLPKAWAGVLLYQAEQSMDAGKNLRAFNRLEKSKVWDKKNPRVFLLQARNSVLLGKRSGEVKWHVKAHSYAKRLTKVSPYYDLGWFYRGLSLSETSKIKGGGVPQEARVYFDKALEKGPGNVRLRIAIAKVYFESLPEGSPEIAHWLEFLKQSLAEHYLNRPSPYLASALSFVFKQYHNPDFLIRMTPDDAPSRKVLSRFFKEKQLGDAGGERIQ